MPLMLFSTSVSFHKKEKKWSPYGYLLICVVTYTHDGVIEEMEDIGFVDHLFCILRNLCCSVNGENVVSIVLRMCCLNTGNRDRERGLGWNWSKKGRMYTRHLWSLQSKDHNVQWQKQKRFCSGSRDLVLVKSHEGNHHTQVLLINKKINSANWISWSM